MKTRELIEMLKPLVGHFIAIDGCDGAAILRCEGVLELNGDNRIPTDDPDADVLLFNGFCLGEAEYPCGVSLLAAEAQAARWIRHEGRAAVLLGGARCSAIIRQVTLLPYHNFHYATESDGGSSVA